MKKTIMCLSAVLILTVSITTVTLLFKYQPSVKHQEALTASGCIVDTLYPDETDCTRFYKCAPYGLQLFSCPLGLHFNPLANYCDWPDVAGCVVLTSQESILASTEQELFSELSQSDYEDVTTVLSVTELTDEKQTVNDTISQLLEGTTDKISSAGPLEDGTTLEDFDEGQNKSTYSNSHSIDQTIVPGTDTASTNEIYTDDSITVYETQKTHIFSSSFTTNVKDYFGASETHNLITSESSKIPEPDAISTNGLTSSNVANNQLDDTNLEIINSRLDSTLSVLKSTSEVTTIFLPEMVSGSYLTIATNSEIEPESNGNYVTQEITISSESSVIDDILSVDISYNTSPTDVPLTNTVVPEVHTQPSSSFLSVSNSHAVISRKTTVNILESSTISANEKNDNVLSTTQTFVTSDKLTATDEFTYSVYTTKANFEVTTKGHVFFTSKSSTLSETTIIDKPSTVSDDGKEIGIASITESNGNYIEISNSETQNLVTMETFSVLTDESTIENDLKPSTTEYSSSTQNDITSLNTSNEEPHILTQPTMSEKIEDEENYAVNQHGNSFSTDQNITVTKEPSTVSDKFTVSIEEDLTDTETLAAKSSVSDEGKSDGIPSTPQTYIKITENIQFSSQYGFASPNIQDVVTNMSQILTVESILSTADNSPTTSNDSNFTTETTNFEIIHSNKTTVPNLENPQNIIFSEDDSSFVTQSYSTKTSEQDTMSTKITPSVTNEDLLTDQFMEYTSSALYASTLDVFASETVTDVIVEQPSNNIVSVQYTSQIKSEEFSTSTANLITEQILKTTQGTIEENSTEEAFGDENGLSLQVNTTPEIEVFSISENPLILMDATPKVIQDVIATKVNRTLLEEIPSTSATRVTSTISNERTTSISFTDSTLESYLDNDPDTIGLNISKSEILYKPSGVPSPISSEIENVATYTIHNTLITQLKENVTNISSDSESEQEITSDFSSTQNKFLIDKSTPGEIPAQDDNTSVTESVGVLNTYVLNETINNVLTVTPSNLVIVDDTSRVTVIEEIFTDELHIIETTTPSIEKDTVTENITNGNQADFHANINELQNESSQSSTKKSTGFPSGGIAGNSKMDTVTETIAHQESTKVTLASTNVTYFIIENVDKIQNIVQDAVGVGLETINDFIEIVDNKHSNKHKHDKDESDDDDDDDDDDVDNEEKSRPYNNKNKDKNNNDEDEDRNHKDDDGRDENNHNGDNHDKEGNRHNSHKHHHGKKPNGGILDRNYNENNTNNSYITKRESSDSEDTVDVGLETIKDFIEIVDGNKHNNNKHKHDKDDEDGDVDNDEKRRPYNNHKHNKNKNKNNNDEDRNHKDGDGRDENNHNSGNDDKEKDLHNSHKHHHGKKPTGDSLDRNYNENNTNNSHINKRESNRSNNKNTERTNIINKSNFAKKSEEKRSTKPAKNYVHQNGRNRKRGKGNIGNKEENLEIFYKIIGKYKKTVKWS